MSAERLLSELRALDVRVFVVGDQVRCNAPQGRLTSDLKMKIAANRAELIGVLRASSPQAGVAVRRSVPGEIQPLSFAQERFWFLQNLDPESTAFNITAYRPINAPIDTAALERALRGVLQKHEVLRANFPEMDGAPIQVIRDATFAPIEIHDLSHSDVEVAIGRLSQRKFDLARDPLLRVSLFRLAEREHIIVLALHHIICDGWSFGILFEELKSFYKSAHPAGIPELPLQYSDYVVWERNRQTSATFAAQLDYWRKKLEGAPPSLDIPLDYVRPRTAGCAAKLHRFELDLATSESLKSLARQEGATPFMALLTVFKALLFRYTRQVDIVVGTPVSTRLRPEFERLVGCFINTQVLRSHVSGDMTTRELLAGVRATVVESLSNADVPFETLVKELVADRDLSRSPLFQVSFILQNTPLASEYHIVSGGTAVDLTLYMWESNSSIGGSFEYRADLFSPRSISRIAGCYATLAAGMAAQPGAAIGRLPILTMAQQAEWFETHDGPRIFYPRNLSTSEWIEKQAALTPDAVAVICGDEELSYRELSERSNRLANRLRALGVGSDNLVGLCVERSVDLVVVPLAIWKAGGAYVPLDPEYPSQRLAFMLKDSGAAVLVTESRLLAKLPRDLPSVVCLDRERRRLEAESADAPALMATAENLAYVIYTSGSTGQPKGVEIRHRSLVNLLGSMQREPGIGPSDRLLAVTTLSFDIAGLELFLPLVSGAKVVIAPRVTAFNGEALAKLLTDSGITIMQATPVTWRLLLESGWTGSSSLKILCGGEALTPELAERLLTKGAEVWNLYGPTETTIWSTVQRIRAGAAHVPIGHPIANTQVHVMDEYGQPVPPGVAGELYIGGDGLGRGYRHRKDLTAEQFVAHPFQEGDRLYRTGDLVRRLSDGSLECIGRVDRQVKLRGFRIELGEIEKALEQQPGIGQAVAVMREDTPGDPRLIAYVTGSVPGAGVLRKALQAILPDYMVPSAFVQLDQFPLTPNRKVDRHALLAAFGVEPLREEIRSQSAGGCVTPRNHVEMVMTEIWCEVLGLDRVSVQDNFFELGGHSLSATRLISRLRSTLSMDLPLQCIFLDPTIAALASHIVYDAPAKTYRYISHIPRWGSLVPAQPKGTRTPFFFIGGAYGPDAILLVLSQLFAPFEKDQPIFGLQHRGSDGVSQGYSSVDEAARKFLSEMRAVQPKGPYVLGGHCVGGIAALEVAKLLMDEGEDVKLVVLVDTARPTPMRNFLNELHFIRERGRHIVDVISEIFQSNPQQRREIIQRLIRRKLGHAHPENIPAEVHSMVHYRKLMNKHTIAHYRGRITLIVNQEEASVDRNFGWKGVVQGGLDVRVIPGDHGTILEHHGNEVGQLILRSIHEALADNWQVEVKVS